MAFEVASIQPRKPLPRGNVRLVAMETRLQKATMSSHRENQRFSAWGPLHFAAAPEPGSPFISSGPAIYEALEDQLGLRLVPAEAPLDVFVIESAEQLSVN